MRILHCSDRLTDRGGAYRHLFGILSAQLEDHEVMLAVGRDDGSARAEAETKIVEGLDARLRAPVHLDPTLEEWRPDVVHLHNVVNPEALEHAGRFSTAVVTVQDHRVFCPAQGKWTSRGETCREAMSRTICRDCFTDDAYFEEVYGVTAERLAALAPFRVVTLSEYIKRELVAAGARADRIEVIPPFVHELDLDAPPDGPPSVLFVGRLVEAKGVRDALEAWKLANVELPLRVAGAGPLREELEREDGVELLGWVPHHRMSGIYRSARALLMPSRWQEPFGIAGLEALTMGVPVVAWESGGIGEWHPGPLVPWGDVDGLARELEKVVGTRAAPPVGFDREASMARLDAVYRV